MPGIKDLTVLLASIEPVLDEREFVFCTFPVSDRNRVEQLDPICFFREKEGITLIITCQKAMEHDIHYEGVYRLISLTVHSSLDAVGLTAAFSAKLAEKDISANVVAGYYHDHIFVPAPKAEQAMEALMEFGAGRQDCQ